MTNNGIIPEKHFVVAFRADDAGPDWLHEWFWTRELANAGRERLLDEGFTVLDVEDANER